MTGDEQLNTYLRRIQDIIDELYRISDEVKSNIQGLEQEKCIQSLEDIAEKYNEIMNIIITNYQ